MPTYRCLSCGGIYINPQHGVEIPHACPLDRVTGRKGERTPIENPRDETRVEGKPGRRHHIKKPGKGRELLSEDDLLTGLDPDKLTELQRRPGLGLAPMAEEVEDLQEPTIAPGTIR